MTLKQIGFWESNQVDESKSKITGELGSMRVAHYLNQFFGGLGGEDQANTAPQTQDTAVGPGRLLEQMLGED